MSDDTASHTLRLLQEMRAEISDGFKEVNARVDDLAIRMDGMTHVLIMLAGEIHRHDDRIEALENRPSPTSITD